MTYKPQPGDFGVVTVKGTVGRLIRIGQWLIGGDYSNYEHAFVYVGDVCYKGTVDGIVEAEPEGARLSHLSEYADRDIAWYRCPPGLGITVAIKAVCLLGTPYSFMDYVAIACEHAIWPIRKTLGRWFRNYVASSHHMICSQLVDEAYKRAGIQLFNDGRFPGDVTPWDLYELIVDQQRRYGD